MVGNYIYNEHPINDRMKRNTNHPEMADYIDNAKYHGNVNKSLMDLSRTHGTNIDGIRR